MLLSTIFKKNGTFVNNVLCGSLKPRTSALSKPLRVGILNDGAEGALVLLYSLSELTGLLLNGVVSSPFVYLIQNEKLPKDRKSN